MNSLLLLMAFFGSSADVDLKQLKLPPGYTIEIAAKANNLRQISVANPQTVFGGSRSAGKVYALQDLDGDQVYEKVSVIAENLNMPSGVVYKGNDLYVAEVHRILKFKDILPLSDQPITAEVYFDRLPSKRHHGWKYLKFGPDGALYFNIGAPCNICLSEPPFATLVRLNQNKQLEIIASGVRNSVGFTWHPLTEKLWFTDNGRDYLGDDQPSDELNRLDHIGQHFGYPYRHANNVADPIFAEQGQGGYSTPMFDLGAHVAPLGLTFYQGDHFQGQPLFIAEHGSWNRSEKVGYRVVKLSINEGKVSQHEVFISGWLQGEQHWGRPNDVVVDQDGSLLISDDYAGLLYRVSKTKPDQ